MSQYRTPAVPAEWATSRETHAAVAMAIHAIADESRSPEAIWEGPTPAEWDHVAMAVEDYIDNGLFPQEPDGRYPWGGETIVIDPKLDAAEVLRRFAEATNNELFDPDYRGGEWMVEAVETAETLDHWVESSEGWSERSKMARGEIAGVPYIAWRVAQTAKGQPRRSMSVIDLGDTRIAIGGYLPDFS